MSTKLATPQELLSLGRVELGTSSWVQITQEQVNEFADATGDRQWIHIDTERAKSGPFGGTIVHGYLTLALAPAFLDEVLEIASYDVVLNYGVNKVRFPAPLRNGRTGARARHAAVGQTSRQRHGRSDVRNQVRDRRQGPAPCAAESVYLYQ